MGYNVKNPGIIGRLYAFFSILCVGLLYVPIFFLITLLMAMGWVDGINMNGVNLSLHVIVFVAFILAVIGFFQKEHKTSVMVLLYAVLVNTPLVTMAFQKPIFHFLDDHNITFIRHIEEQPQKLM